MESLQKNYVPRIGSKALKKPTVKSLQKQINGLKSKPEIKKHFVEAQHNATYNGVVSDLSTIAGGSESYQRIGNEAMAKSISIKGRLSSDIHGTTSMEDMRVILFWDYSENPGTVTAADLLQTVGNGYAPYTPLDDDNRKRFKVLRSEIINFDGNNTVRAYNWFVRLNKKMRWNSSTATDKNKGHLMICTISGTITAGRNYNLFSAVLNYTDA